MVPHSLSALKYRLNLCQQWPLFDNVCQSRYEKIEMTTSMKYFLYTSDKKEKQACRHVSLVLDRIFRINFVNQT